jgi:hypothetical protein
MPTLDLPGNRGNQKIYAKESIVGIGLAIYM